MAEFHGVALSILEPVKSSLPFRADLDRQRLGNHRVLYHFPTTASMYKVHSRSANIIMQHINSFDSIIAVSKASDKNDNCDAMSQPKSSDIEKSIGELSKPSRRPSIVEIFADPADELDPQNWKPWKKRLVFIALMSSSILCDGYVVLVAYVVFRC